MVKNVIQIKTEVVINVIINVKINKTYIQRRIGSKS